MIRRLHTAEPGFAAALAALASDRASATDVAAPVAAIIARVRAEGDAALIDLTRRYDRFPLTPETLRVSAAEIDAACARVGAGQLEAIDLAATRIEAFHRAQLPRDIGFTDAAGARLGLRWGPLDAVGLYVPGGKASYPSSVLMNAIPARVAGVGRIAMCVPTPDGQMNDLVLAAARRAGVAEIYRVGGAQAVAALAYGTATIAPVDRIVGPGNAFVAEAKRQVFGQVGIDSIAGPSEVLIIADAGQDPWRVALDMIAQAEHDEAAQSLLVTDDAALAEAVAAELARALETLPRASIAAASLAAHGAIIIARDLDEAAEIANRVAPEHLQVMTADPDAVFARIRHAGAAFLGADAPTAIGDYVAGPNHVLPTGGTARFSSGLSVFDFLKRTTFVALDPAAMASIGPAAATLAVAESLDGHARSIRARLTRNRAENLT
ncbi:histidinol dehydrogenase [Acidiphilium sp.]|uniref:histidinol dehydrogenase n=1 Tax=Acidiphilium sp. TaxID=527 RepID=UPI0025885EAD|nr:histidinol dehydrogenase [Acidiphilium sp.]